MSGDFLEIIFWVVIIAGYGLHKLYRSIVNRPPAPEKTASKEEYQPQVGEPSRPPPESLSEEWEFAEMEDWVDSKKAIIQNYQAEGERRIAQARAEKRRAVAQAGVTIPEAPASVVETEKSELPPTLEESPVVESAKPEPPLLEPETAAFAEETSMAEPGPGRLSTLDFNLRSPADLKRGIVLAEILGPCRAKKKAPRIK